jgi:hypothetical protein
VAEFAQSQIDFDPPASVLSPSGRQIVGVATWLAVTSELEDPDVTAQAGLAWATVRTRFVEAVWDLGDGAVVTCTDDVATTWNPAVDADVREKGSRTIATVRNPMRPCRSDGIETAARPGIEFPALGPPRLARGTSFMLQIGQSPGWLET